MLILFLSLKRIKANQRKHLVAFSSPWDGLGPRFSCRGCFLQLCACLKPTHHPRLSSGLLGKPALTWSSMTLLLLAALLNQSSRWPSKSYCLGWLSPPPPLTLEILVGARILIHPPSFVSTFLRSAVENINGLQVHSIVWKIFSLYCPIATQTYPVLDSYLSVPKYLIQHKSCYFQLLKSH